MEGSFWQRIGVREGRGGVGETPPARGWARPRRLWLMWAAPTLLTGLLATAIVAVALDGGPHPVLTHDLALAALAAALLVAAILWVATVRSLWRPLAHLRCWAMRVRDGNLSARIPEDRAAGEFAELASDVNALGSA